MAITNAIRMAHDYAAKRVNEKLALQLQRCDETDLQGSGPESVAAP